MKALISLFLIFFKIGAFTFGGGYAMLPLIQEEILKNNWMSEEDIINFIAVSESTPGPFAINAATFVGHKVAGILGSIFATLGVVLPSFIVILTVALFYEKFKKSTAVKGIMSGLRPAVIGLILAAVLKMAIEVFFPNGFLSSFGDAAFYVSVFTFLIMLFLLLKKKLSPILLIVLSAVIGIASGYIIEIV